MHRGENIGNTPSHALFVELKESARPVGSTSLGPSVAVQADSDNRSS